ncbi:hypothetical protein [Nocardioides malaquae]|uniref:hypothetical protein n=1 Tax=Nocardioides malaquae TaxID=2773426 RepID=UPI001D0D5B29|nr:hypothetical protein [Nocardioides malaquae]
MGDDGHVWETHPVTPERFDDFADVVNPNRRENHCWCLSHRCTAGEIAELGESREEAMRNLTRTEPQGVVTYRDGVPVGWCSIGPRSHITRLSRSKLIRPVDDLDVWSIICVVVRGGQSDATPRDAADALIAAPRTGCRERSASVDTGAKVGV